MWVQDLCIPVSAQIWQQAVSELQARRKSMPAVATLINAMLRM